MEPAGEGSTILISEPEGVNVCCTEEQKAVATGRMRSVPPRSSGWVPIATNQLTPLIFDLKLRASQPEPSRYRVVVLTSFPADAHKINPHIERQHTPRRESLIAGLPRCVYTRRLRTCPHFEGHQA